MGVGAKSQGNAGECKKMHSNVWEWVQCTVAPTSIRSPRITLHSPVFLWCLAPTPIHSPGVPLHFHCTLHTLPCISLALCTHSHTFPWHSPAFPCIPLVLCTHSQTLLCIFLHSPAFPWHFAPIPIRFPGIPLHSPAFQKHQTHLSLIHI